MSTLLEQVVESRAPGEGVVAARVKKLLRILAAAAIALIGILIVTSAGPAHKDYISYWSAGKLLTHHADPYSRARVLALEDTEGYSQTRPLIMRNPPWTLFLAAPLGFVNARAGLLLWTIAAVGSILLCLHLLDVPLGDRAIAFLFVPTLSAIIAGQTSFLLLLGFSLFLRFHRSRPFLAGVSLLLLAIKPHLLLFWALLLIDCILRRSFRLLAGSLSALAAATGFAMWLDPHVWQHYFTMLQDAKLDEAFVPTISIVFRLFVDGKAVWLQLVPSVAALVWACWYYVRNRRVWDWRTNGMLLMLVTVLVSPYSWFPDEIVLLPSIMFGLSQRRKHAFEVLMAINTAVLLLFLIAQIPLTSGAYLWTPAAWLGWFLYANGRNGYTNKEEARTMEMRRR